MALEQTKKTLSRLLEKYGKSLRQCKQDIKPAQSYDQVGNGTGYVYYGIDALDRDYIYESIGTLNESINDPYGAIHFNITHFVTYSNAIKELEILTKLILADLNKLQELDKKYKYEKCAHYPLQESLRYHQEIYNILDDISKSEEYILFNNPGQLESISSENKELKFMLYWYKRKWSYIIHLVAFFAFLFFAGWTFFQKENNELIGLSKTAIFLISSFITILFNLVFNNHNSFKDSWKLLRKSSRDKLIAKEKQSFFK